MRGDLQEPNLDFDPNKFYAPFASHESIHILLDTAASDNLFVEWDYVASTYLYGKIYYAIFMEQPTDSAGILKKPGRVRQLFKSMYVLRKSVQILGSLFTQNLNQWGFRYIYHRRHSTARKSWPGVHVFNTFCRWHDILIKLKPYYALIQSEGIYFVQC